MEGAMKSIFAACLIACAFAPFNAEAQSFPCSRARTADEIAICENPGLAALDMRLHNTYNRVRGRLSGRARQALIDEELGWLASRRGCGSDVGCIEDSYRQRINELNSNY
jgi:uncharacterized protein